MRKLLIMVVVILAMVVGIVFNVHVGKQGKGLSDLALANIEALAQNEDGGGSDPSTANYYCECIGHVGGWWCWADYMAHCGGDIYCRYGWHCISLR